MNKEAKSNRVIEKGKNVDSQKKVHTQKVYTKHNLHLKQWTGTGMQVECVYHNSKGNADNSDHTIRQSQSFYSIIIHATVKKLCLEQ